MDYTFDSHYANIPLSALRPSVREKVPYSCSLSSDAIALYIHHPYLSICKLISTLMLLSHSNLIIKLFVIGYCNQIHRFFRDFWDSKYSQYVYVERVYITLYATSWLTALMKNNLQIGIHSLTDYCSNCKYKREFFWILRSEEPTLKCWRSANF